MSVATLFTDANVTRFLYPLTTIPVAVLDGEARGGGVGGRVRERGGGTKRGGPGDEREQE